MASRFHKLQNDDESFNITSRRPFIEMVDLRNYVDKCVVFAYDMTFGGDGEHRNHRTGGTEHRNLLEQFQNALQGKMAEYGLYAFLRANGFEVEEPNLDTYGEGIWDDVDLIVNDKRISVKSSTHFSQLLLLEKEDWDENGFYIPNGQNEGDCYDYFVFCRIKPDSKSIFVPTMIGQKTDLQTFKSIAYHQHWVLDVPGYITRQNLIRLIKDNFVLPKGGKLNGKTMMDADNYYCQAGDLWDTDFFLDVLKGIKPKGYSEADRTPLVSGR